jgi:hypothetical protein
VAGFDAQRLGNAAPKAVALTVELGGFLEMTMETNHYKTTAYAIRIGDEWFAGFGGKPGQESLTKVRPGLCDAKLVWDERKAAAYVERLRVRGYMGEIVKVTA